MFTEILKIIPRIDNGSLLGMERSLNGRFLKVSKQFGKGLFTALKGGGVLGIATTLIDKFLNPLQEVQEAIDKSLSRGDDLSTFAKQFNTTAGNLARLEAFGKASGLDPQGVRELLGKFQTAVTQAAADPSKTTAVSKFVGRKDTAEAFFEFVQSAQKLNPTQKNFVQQEVFGEKQTLKASDFLNANFPQLAKQVGGPSSDQLTVAAERLGAMSDARDVLRAKRDLNDLLTKSKLIGPQTIKGLDAKEALDLQQENKNLGNFQGINQLSIENQKLINMAMNEFLKLAPVLAGLLGDIVVGQGLIKTSRALRGMTGEKDK